MVVRPGSAAVRNYAGRQFRLQGHRTAQSLGDLEQHLIVLAPCLSNSVPVGEVQEDSGDGGHAETGFL